jgi:parallel beta-helix repeat protein
VPIREGGARRGVLARRLAALTVIVAALALAQAAAGAAIEVRPGPNAIHKALRSAHNGDTLRIHKGTYRESVALNKRVRLRGVGGRPTIDARCGSRTTFDVNRGGFALDHLMVVGGADGFGYPPSEIDATQVGTGTINDVVVHNTCGPLGVGAQYGINVFDTGPVVISNSRATGGFTDAGIYVGQITDTGGQALKVVSNTAFSNHQGIIVENSGGNAIIQVANNNTHHNTIAGVGEPAAGMFISNSDGVRIRNNTVRSNGEFGVNVSTGSDHNRLIGNTITGNPTDLNNQGSANCGSGNTIGSRAGNPLMPCG